MRQRIFELVGPAGEYDYASRAYDVFIVFVAVLSLVPMLFDSSKISGALYEILWVLDVITAFILLFDYVLRWLTADYKMGKGIKAFFLYPITPMAIIDLLAILPTLQVIPQTFRFLRILRVVKVFRYSRNLVVVTNAITREAKTLWSVFLAAIIYMLTVALVIFTAEPEAFDSFFEAVCWAACQMTSVAYADARPTSYLGSTLSMLSGLVALLVVALPAGVITGAYINEVHESKENTSKYFRMTGHMKRKMTDYDSVSTWFKKNRKIFRYTMVMICTFVAGLAISGVMLVINSPLWMDDLGVAWAAFLLEPAAGIIVAFAMGIIATIFHGNTTAILYVISYATTAIAFGVVFPRSNSSHRALRVVAVLAILTFISSMTDGTIALLQSGWDISQVATDLPKTMMVAQWISGLNLDFMATIVLAYNLQHALDAILMVILFEVAVRFFGVQAAPSEKERQQQQQIQLERALQQREFENQAMRDITRETLVNKYNEVIDQLNKLDAEKTKLEHSIAELDAEEALAQIEEK